MNVCREKIKDEIVEKKIEMELECKEFGEEGLINEEVNEGY